MIMNNMCEEKNLGKTLCDACVEKNWLLIFFTKKVRAKLETYVINRFKTIVGTVRPLLSGYPEDFEKWLLNRGTI